MRSLLAKLKLW